MLLKISPTTPSYCDVCGYEQVVSVNPVLASYTAAFIHEKVPPKMCVYVRMCVCTYVCMYVRVYVCTYVCMYVCVYV